MLVKVKQDYRYKSLVAFGLEFVKYEPREVPEERQAEAKRHPALEVVEAVKIEPEGKQNYEPKRTRK